MLTFDVEQVSTCRRCSALEQTVNLYASKRSCSLSIAEKIKIKGVTRVGIHKTRIPRIPRVSKRFCSLSIAEKIKIKGVTRVGILITRIPRGVPK